MTLSIFPFNMSWRRHLNSRTLKNIKRLNNWGGQEIYTVKNFLRETILYIPHIWYESKALGSLVICWLMCYTKSIDQFHYSCIQQDMTYCIRVPNTERDITSIFLIKIKKMTFPSTQGNCKQCTNESAIAIAWSILVINILESALLN